MLLIEVLLQCYFKYRQSSLSTQVGGWWGLGGGRRDLRESIDFRSKVDQTRYQIYNLKSDSFLLSIFLAKLTTDGLYIGTRMLIRLDIGTHDSKSELLTCRYRPFQVLIFTTFNI